MFGLYGPEFENVKESWFLIMLFTDIPKVTRMAQFALTSSHQRRIPANVAVGMAQVILRLTSYLALLFYSFLLSWDQCVPLRPWGRYFWSVYAG